MNDHHHSIASCVIRKICGSTFAPEKSENYKKLVQNETRGSNL